MTGNYTKCGDKKCSARFGCWRYICPSAPQQSYADFNREADAERCDDFVLVSGPLAKDLAKGQP
jgi:hypothetical protein